MKENIDSLQRQNPEFTYYLYDDDMCRDFIKNNFDNEVLYTFDKLKPGAYKSDLWRYCILYIKGGIYLDIKYNCINGFKLIELTDKEYYVKDREYFGIVGIYQALLACLPKSKLLLDCIQCAVENVKNNNYEYSELYICGPHMVSKLFNNIQLNNIELYFTGDCICRNDVEILNIYSEYRKEQDTYKTEKYKYSKNENEYYKFMWIKKNVYDYPVLQPVSNIDLTRKINMNVMGIDTELYSGTPTIIEYQSGYIVNMRWINYSYNEDGSKKNIPNPWISLNSRFFIDENFNKISDEIFLGEDYEKQKNFCGIGLEDIRLFYFNGKFYYTASYFCDNRNCTSQSSGVYNINHYSYSLNRDIILPNMYDIDKIKIIEKNWSFVNYKNELCIIYKWFPLQIGKINYDNNKLNIIKIIYDIPIYFKEARGSTPGFIKDNEIWFVLHKAQYYDDNNNRFYNYQHFFAVFDLDMNLIRYSELFKFGGCKVEFCVGLIIKENQLLLSYSILDTQSMISVYDMDYINNEMKWYIN